MLRRLLAGIGWWDAIAAGGPTRLLGLNALIDALGAGLVAVCLPFFAMFAAGLSVTQLPAALAVAGACELLAAVPNGALAGRLGVHRYVVVTKLVGAAAYALVAFAHGLLPILLAVGVAGAARAGSGGLNQSLTVAVLGEERRAAVLGTVRALRNIGYLIAGGAGALLLAAGSNTALRGAVIAEAVALVASAALVARLSPRVRPPQPEHLDWSVLTNGRYLGLIATATVFTSSLAVLDIGLPLWVVKHPDIPRWTVAAVVIVNTVLVILFQHPIAARITAVPQAMRALRISTAGFVAMAGLIALTASTPAWLSVALLLISAVALTIGEMLESPSWWTLSYELAPPARKDEYLAAFDLCFGVMGIVGPMAMALVVAHGAAGWASYAGVLVVALLTAGRLVPRRHAEAAIVQSAAV